MKIRPGVYVDGKRVYAGPVMPGIAMTKPPVFNIRRTFIERLCGWLTRHRWLRTMSDWRAGVHLMGRVWERDQRCVVCGAGFTEWKSRLTHRERRRARGA